MNTLSRISDDYWIVRDEWANVVGVVVRHGDRYTGYLNGQNPEVLASIEAVVDYVRSDADHHIDHRLSAELVTTLAAHATR